MNPLSLAEKAVLKAMQEFDRELRGSREWEYWQASKAHKYAIEHDERLYPVKMIASIASGVPVRDFGGGIGRGQANEIFQESGVKIVDLHPINPDWSRDELIVALNFYLGHRPSPSAKGSKKIKELSEQPNRPGKKLFSLEGRSETFRNENGIYMKLMNFRRLDPQYTAECKVGLSRVSRAEQVVWKEFAIDPLRCQMVTDAIIASLDAPALEAGSGFDAFTDHGIQESVC